MSRRSLLSRVLIVVALAPLTLLVPTSSPAATPSAAQLIAQARANAIHAKWVHEVQRFYFGIDTYVSTNTISTNGGYLVTNSATGGNVTLITFLSQKVAYEKADLTGVGTYYNITGSAAAHYANRWVKVTPVDKEYNGLVLETSLASDFDNYFVFPPNATLGPVTSIEGVEARKITASSAATATQAAATYTAYVTTTSPVLPVLMEKTQSSSSYFALWTKWGVPAPYAAPTVSIPFPPTATLS